MGETTKIQWADHTFNAWIGCTKVSPGCQHCYAENLMDKRWKKVEWGPEGERVVTSDANWRQPDKWNRQAEKEGVRRRVFCCSLADVFEDRPEVVYWREQLFELIEETPYLDWMLLTKRPENIRSMWPLRFKRGDINHAGEEVLENLPLRLGNVWLYTSVENQECADKRIPELLKCRDLVPVLGLSIEPLLGEIDLLIDGECSDWRCPQCGSRDVDPEAFQPANDFKQYHCRSCKYTGDPGEEPDWKPLVDHVIIGGESGHDCRPCDIEWIRSIMRQCKAAGVPVFVKQLGGYAFDSKGADNVPGTNRVFTKEELENPIAKAAAAVALERTLEAMMVPTKDPKGGDPSEWPEDLRIREMPEVAHV